MTKFATQETYGVLTEPATLTIRRRLPGPAERIWAYLTESELRRQWLAAGEMEMKVGAPVELVWRNDELTNPPGERPPGFSEEHRMESRITELDPPHRLAITWGSTGGVSFGPCENCIMSVPKPAPAKVRYSSASWPLLPDPFASATTPPGAWP